jgi:hypothetical protein
LRKLDASDWLAFLAVIGLICLVSVENKLYPYDVEVWEYHAGYGPKPTDDHVIYDYKLQVVEADLMGFTMTCVKLSLLFFYRSIFGINKRLARVCEFTMGGVVTVFLYCVFSMLWLCGNPNDLFDLRKFPLLIPPRSTLRDGTDSIQRPALRPKPTAPVAPLRSSAVFSV